VPVLGDIELFAWEVRERSAAKVLAVTGTNGKSTVTALTGAPAARGRHRLRSRRKYRPAGARCAGEAAATRHPPRGRWSSPATSSKPPGQLEPDAARCST
jgi:hypothetical protein